MSAVPDYLNGEEDPVVAENAFRRAVRELWCIQGLKTRADLNGTRVRVRELQAGDASERVVVDFIDEPDRPSVSVARKNLRMEEMHSITFDMVCNAMERMETGDRSISNFEYALKNNDIFGAFRATSEFTAPRTADQTEAVVDRILETEKTFMRTTAPLSDATD